MDEYKLIWAGKLWSVSVPDEVDDRYRWIYVQTYVANGGNHRVAMMSALQTQYPGLGYGAPTSATAHARVVGVSAFGMCSPSSSTRSHSQKPRPPPSSQGGKNAASGTSGRHTRAPPPATSSASRPRDQQPVGPSQKMQQKTTPAATARTGGWLGSTATSASGR